ncbi:MAG TPA: hypothetical protein DCS30_05960 [Rhizobiales bacterium]|nr:hypothetical protein [Hyphomicrobiales bacterium]
MASNYIQMILVFAGKPMKFLSPLTYCFTKLIYGIGIMSVMTPQCQAIDMPVSVMPYRYSYSHEVNLALELIHKKLIIRQEDIMRPSNAVLSSGVQFKSLCQAVNEKVGEVRVATYDQYLENKIEKDTALKDAFETISGFVKIDDVPNYSFADIRKMEKPDLAAKDKVDDGKKNPQAEMDDKARVGAYFKFLLQDLENTLAIKEACETGQLKIGAKHTRLIAVYDGWLPSCREYSVSEWLLRRLFKEKKLKEIRLNCASISDSWEENEINATSKFEGEIFLYNLDLDYLEVRNSSLATFSVKQVSVKSYFGIQNVTVSDELDISHNNLKSLTIKELKQTQGKEKGRFFINQNRIERDITISNSEVAAYANMKSNDVGWSIEVKKSNFNEGLYITSNRIINEFAIYDSKIKGPVKAYNLHAGIFRFERTIVDGNFNADMMNVKNNFFFRYNSKILGNFTAHYLKFNNFTIGDSNVVGKIKLYRIVFSGTFLLYGSKIDSIYIESSKLNEVSISYNVISYFDLYNSEASNLKYNSNHIKKLTIDEVSARSVGFYKSSHNEGLETNRIDELKLEFMSVSNYINIGHGYVKDLLSLKGTRVEGEIWLASDGNFFFDRDTKIDLRGSKSKQLLSDLNAFITDKNISKKAYLSVDVTGADFSSFFHYDLAKERETSTANPNIQEIINNKEKNNIIGLHEASSDELLALFVFRQKRYNPQLYDMLSKAMSNSGHKTKAKHILIEKNRAFAAHSDSFITKAVYWLADRIIGFGYDQMHALKLYFILVGSGSLLYWSWRNWSIIRIFAYGPHPERAIRLMILAFRSKRKVQNVNIWPRRSLSSKSRNIFYAFWFSLDRSLPPLNLDSAFSTHHGMSALLANWFYFQRTACFIVISFFIIGSFGLFQ